MRTQLRPTEADQQIKTALDTYRNFAVVAGAGSGKTTSLVEALKHIRKEHGGQLRQDGQQIVCITYTKRAVAVISERLRYDSLFHISTIHSFLWSVIGRFQWDIREALRVAFLPSLIERTIERDNGGASKKAAEARAKAIELKNQLAHLDQIVDFRYDDGSSYSNFATGQLGHDDMVDLATYLILERPLLQRIIGARYPYIFVDEAQDAFDSVVNAFNAVCNNDGLPLVGYFGDPMQQIYGYGTGTFTDSEGIFQITKKENFRSAPPIVDLLNVFRKDVQQFPAGQYAAMEGSVRIMLVQAENPEGERRRYTVDQLDRALENYDASLERWGWENNVSAKRLFLVRQMIARRLGFLNLHTLFTGKFASAKAQNDYEDGQHFLLKPFVSTLCPLIEAKRKGHQRKIVEILGQTSPAFDPTGINSKRNLKTMLDMAISMLANLMDVWGGNVRDVLLFAQKEGLCNFSPHLIAQIEREPRTEEYDDELHSIERSDWLSDAFFEMPTDELLQYSNFVQDNTPFSTQHGSKGEQYEDVLVVFDDIEAAWTQYSFTKLLTPATSGEATDSQQDRTRKLAYVCFSRAMINLRIILFTLDSNNAYRELIGSGLFGEEQIEIL